MTRESLIDEMKVFSGSSFMSIAELTKWSGRSREYVINLIHPLEWITTDSGKSKSFFIPDVADAIMDRQLPREERGFYSLFHGVNRDPYRDDLIGDRARGKKVSMYYDTDFKRDAVALADKIGPKNAADVLDINRDTLGSWLYSREKEKGEFSVYAGTESENMDELFARIAEVYVLDVEDLRDYEKRYCKSISR